MARGLTRDQLGITDELIASFGETIFRMSHNWQVREGDPVRRLDFAEIERQREGMGLADVQIASRLGLTREQVMFIRNHEESRRFRTGQQAYLLDLGGGRRFRSEKVVPLEDRFRYGEDALRLRAALAFPPKLVERYVSGGFWRDDTLTGWLASHARIRPDAPALVLRAETISYRELHERVLRIAEGLRRAGVQRGDVVAIQLPNVPEFVITYLAVCRLGAVVCTVHMAYRTSDLEALLRHSRAKAIVCTAGNKDWSPASACLEMESRLPALKLVVTIDAPPPGAIPWQPWADLPPIEERAAPLPVASDPFVLLYTSGTTSAPKGVPHSYHTLLSNARLGAPEHRVTEADRVLSAAPFTHLFGLYSLHVAWAVGAAAVLLPAFTPRDLAETVQRDRPTGLWTAPAHVAVLRAQSLLDTFDFSSLRLAIMSGSACPPDLVRWFAERLPACGVTQLWGMTETQGALYTRPGDPIDVVANSAGRPSPGTEVRVVDPEGLDCAAGVEGELQVRGCLLFPGFLDNAEANESAFTADGWYRTGDLASIDAAGNVRITGRTKDIINRGGVKFNPRDVEDLVDAHPKVLQSAIVPMPDPVLGERACCFVTLRPGAEALTLEELVGFLVQQSISKTKLPERLVVMQELPLTPTRKVIKSRLRIPA
jgi:acyl-CoA synthetase (AMP-forming)/AMP-acid ligase II